MATLNVHKTAKTAAISCLAADVPAAQGGAAAPRCVPAPRGTARSSRAAWGMSQTNHISYTKGKRSCSFHIQPWPLLP